MLRLPSRLRLPLAVALGGLLVIGAVWFGAQTQLRFALWRNVADRPLTGGEGDRLARCDRKPGWWTWVKVLHNDRPVPCGEGWAIDRMAERIERSADRRRWVRQYVDSPDASAVRRLRATLLLNVVGEATPEEPAWLVTPDARLTPEHGAEQARAEAWPWAVHLGPTALARGTMAGMTVAGFPPSEAVGAFEALWAVDRAALRTELVRWTAAGLSVPVTVSEDRWYRRRQGRPGLPAPPGWSRLVRGRAETCPSDEPIPSDRCLTLWRDLLVLDAEDRGEPFEYPLTAPALPEMLPVLEPMGARTRAVEWWLDTAEAWIRAAPDLDRRLASLARGPSSDRPTPRPIAALHDRSATPLMTAAVIVALGRRTGRDVEVRVDEDATVWLSVGTEIATRSRCGTLAPAAPTTPPWSTASVQAGALLEAATAATDPLVASRLVAAAHALDPALTAAPPPPDAASDHMAGFATGRRVLTRASPEPAADPRRSTIGALLRTDCAPPS